MKQAAYYVGDDGGGYYNITMRDTDGIQTVIESGIRKFATALKRRAFWQRKEDEAAKRAERVQP